MSQLSKLVRSIGNRFFANPDATPPASPAGDTPPVPPVEETPPAPFVEETPQVPPATAHLPPNYHPIAEFSPRDVFVVAYPKSGNTWLQNLLAGAVYGLDPRFAPDHLIQSLVPDVHLAPIYKRFQTPMFFKTHFLPDQRYRRVVYLVRDGRDVMVSYHHFLLALQQTDLSLLQLIETGQGLFPCKWRQHVESWLENPFRADVLYSSYERLQANPLAELSRICEFAGLSRSESIVRQAVAGASFESMKAKEQTQGWENPLWPKDQPFVRRGQVNSHQDEMPPEALASFEREAGDVLLRLGYPLAMPQSARLPNAAAS